MVRSTTSFPPPALALGLEKLSLVPRLSMAAQRAWDTVLLPKGSPHRYRHADEVCAAQKTSI